MRIHIQSLIPVIYVLSNWDLVRFASEGSRGFFPAKRQLYSTTHFRKLRNPNEFLVKRGTSHAEESFTEIFCPCTLYDSKTANYSDQNWTSIIVYCDKYRQIYL